MEQSGILVLNAGSSSIKFLFFAERQGELSPVIRGQVEALHTAPRFIARDADGRVLAEKSWGEGQPLGHDGAVAHLAAFLQEHGAGYELRAVGHRVVHGGLDHASPVRLDRDVLAALEKLVPLAPLHQPHNLAPIRVLLERRPQLPQVACFDTAFHATNPDVARRFAIPAELHDAGVRRYGFHGLSYEYVASVLPSVDARAAAGKVVVCHLGNGSSMCAIDGGKSIASTMGFTAVDGLPMGTRAGALDAGVLLYLMDERKMDARAIEKLIYSQSGLLGMSGISSDMRKLLESDDARARTRGGRVHLPHRARTGLAGGRARRHRRVGIHRRHRREQRGHPRAGVPRRRVDRPVFDAQANAGGKPCISAAGSRVSAWVVPTNEELMIARHTQRLLQA